MNKVAKEYEEALINTNMHRKRKNKEDKNTQNVSTASNQSFSVHILTNTVCIQFPHCFPLHPLHLFPPHI